MYLWSITMLYVTPSTLSLPRGMEQKPLSFLFCRHCGLRGATKRCSRCAESYYCNTICQQEDWIYHKNVCGTKGTHGTCEGCHFNIPGIGLYASGHHFPCQVCLSCYTSEWEPQVQTMMMKKIQKRTGPHRQGVGRSPDGEMAMSAVRWRGSPNPREGIRSRPVR